MSKDQDQQFNINKERVPFTQVANSVLNDGKLSGKAKGLYAYIYSKPEGWDFSLHRIKNDFTDGKSSIASGLRELENAGYLRRDKQNNGKVQYKLNHALNSLSVSRSSKSGSGYDPDAENQDQATQPSDQDESLKNRVEPVSVSRSRKPQHAVIGTISNKERKERKSSNRPTTKKPTFENLIEDAKNDEFIQNLIIRYSHIDDFKIEEYLRSTALLVIGDHKGKDFDYMKGQHLSKFSNRLAYHKNPKTNWSNEKQKYVKPDKTNLTEITMSQYPDESIEHYEARVQQREAEGDVTVKKSYNQKPKPSKELPKFQELKANFKSKSKPQYDLQP